MTEQEAHQKNTSGILSFYRLLDKARPAFQHSDINDKTTESEAQSLLSELDDLAKYRAAEVESTRPVDSK